jgi:monothiol glutaredoxin
MSRCAITTGTVGTQEIHLSRTDVWENCSKRGADACSDEVIARGRARSAVDRALTPLISRSATMTLERIKQIVESHPIVLFMKGTPQFPMCGFSSRTVEALKAVGAEFHSVNVLADPELRANLPRYSNWPTFPQLFIQGELIGGCDITLELHQAGELARITAEAQKVS